MYISGVPFSIQYFRAHFGSAPMSGKVSLVLADPIDMCDGVTLQPILNNRDAIGGEGNVYILARRGTCTFGEKASEAEAAGAKGIVYINDRDGISHASAPDVREIKNFSPSMIASVDGEYLISHFSETMTSGGVEAHFIPVACVAEPKSLDTDNFCEPVRRRRRT